MKKLKVRFLGGTHAIYQEMVNYPPMGVKYSGVSQSTQLGKYYQSKKITTKISKLFQILRLPRMAYLPKVKENIIHSSRGILILNEKPWVMDVEHGFSFAGMNTKLWKKSDFLKNIVRKKLESGCCKKIMFHCEASLKQFIKDIDCSKMPGKLTVLYPASHLIDFKREKHDKIRILSVLSLFYAKGGLQVLETFSELEKKYDNIELWLKSDVPEEVKKKYNSRKIRYIPYSSELLSREELIKQYYSKCDMFLYPTFADTFGYSLIDASVAGLPIVASSNFAVPEIVKNGKNGFIVKTPLSFTDEGVEIDSRAEKVYSNFVHSLVDKCSMLIKSKQLRQEMGRESFKLVKSGKFSIKNRNKILKQVYINSLK